MIRKGALGASVSGNGPAFAVVANNKNSTTIKKALSELNGNILISKINNQRATVHEL